MRPANIVVVHWLLGEKGERNLTRGLTGNQPLGLIPLVGSHYTENDMAGNMEDLVRVVATVMEVVKQRDMAEDRERKNRDAREKRTQDQEMRASRCLQSVLVGRGKFDGRDVTRYLEEYRIQTEVQMMDEDVAIQKFATLVEPSLRESVELIVDRCVADGTWRNFERRMKEEFQIEDSNRETHTSFLDWVNERGKKLEPQQLLQEFNRRMSQMLQFESSMD